MPTGSGRETHADVDGPRPRRRRRRWAVATALLALAMAGVAIGVIRTSSPSGTPAPSTGAGVRNGYPTSTQTVTRRSLSETTPVSATLGYAGTYTVVNQAPGIVTSLPGLGQVIDQGKVLYEIAGSPVVLLYGSTPAYRTLSEGEAGPDVGELNADLVDLGDATTASIPAGSDVFTSATADAVGTLQAALGTTRSGSLTLGDAVFLPSAARVTAISATLGAAVGAGQPVMAATSTTRQVTVALDTGQQSEVAVGDRVTITLPDNTTTPGSVSSVGTVATAPSSTSGGGGTRAPTITVEVSPTDPAATGSWDQAPVQVLITAATVEHALAVPIDALVALSGGRYAVEVVGGGGRHHLVDVRLGIFDDAGGLVQVSGSGLAAGQHVVVPGG